MTVFLRKGVKYGGFIRKMPEIHFIYGLPEAGKDKNRAGKNQPGFRAI